MLVSSIAPGRRIDWLVKAVPPLSLRVAPVILRDGKAFRALWMATAANLTRVCLVLAGVAVLGVGLGAIVTVPYLYTVLNSPRGSGATSWVTKLSSFPIFGLESHLHYGTAMLRPFANDILGTADDFRGWPNYLEAPLTYCGLLSLLLLPQTFIAASRRQRIIYGLFLLGMLLPTVFPWFRYLFWLFQGDYYRTHSLFSILGMITLGAIAFSRYVEGRSLNLWLLAATTVIVLLAILYLPSRNCRRRNKP